MMPRYYHYWLYGDSTQKNAKQQKSKRFWSCKIVKTSLCSSIDSSDGVDIYLSVNGKMFGGNMTMDEQTRWKFKQDSTGTNSSALSVTGTPMEEFDIIQADGSHVSYNSIDISPRKDMFSVKKATLDELTFDPETDTCGISIDDWSLTFDDETGWNMKDETKGTYKTKTEDGEQVLLQLDFSKKSWSFRINKTDFEDKIIAKDGIDVILRVGDYEGGIRLDAQQITTLKYKSK